MCPVWVHRFAVLTAGATLVLIFVGALVTSTGSGLAVPDWPLSFGQVFPPMVGLAGLVLLQLTLGALTIWTRRAVLPMTAHVAVGAAVLATSVVIALRAVRLTAAPAAVPGQGFLSGRVVSSG